MRWRKQQPITVLELKCEQLAEPLIMPQSESFYGCFSWVDLGEVSNDLAAEPVLPAARFAEMQADLRNALLSIDSSDIM